MDDDRGSALLRWWARQARRRAAREPGRAPGVPSTTGASPTSQLPLGRRLVGALVPLTRLAAVGRGTVAVVLQPDGGVAVRRPGELLVPRLLARPGAPAVQVLPLSTEPVHLVVPLSGLVTFDGHPLDPVTLRLELQLAATEEYAAVAALAAEHGEGVEAVLLDPVPRACAAAVQGAVAMNRLAQLQRLGLREVLAERWLPASFSGGLLIRCGFAVVEADDVPGRQDEPTVPVPVPVPGLPPVTSPAPLP